MSNRMQVMWPANLARAQQDGLVSEATASKLLSLFQSFQQSYQAAVKDFTDIGLACTGMVGQAEVYGVLLDAICRDAKGDRNREGLLRPLLQIGCVVVDGGRVTGIVTPWHPLRLSAIANKALQVGALLKHLLSAETVFFGDPPRFFKELEAELAHPYYPVIVLGWHDKKPELLSLTDHHLDYSLHESHREPTMRSPGPRPGQFLLLDFFYVVPLLAFPMPVSFLVSQPENGPIAAANGPSGTATTTQARLVGRPPAPSATRMAKPQTQARVEP